MNKNGWYYEIVFGNFGTIDCHEMRSLGIRLLMFSRFKDFNKWAVRYEKLRASGNLWGNSIFEENPRDKLTAQAISDYNKLKKLDEKLFAAYTSLLPELKKLAANEVDAIPLPNAVKRSLLERVRGELSKREYYGCETQLLFDYQDIFSDEKEKGARNLDEAEWAESFEKFVDESFFQKENSSFSEKVKECGRALCINCGDINKISAFSRCDTCGFAPTNDLEAAQSLFFTLKHCDMDYLEAISTYIKEGKELYFDKDQLKRMLDSVREPLVQQIIERNRLQQ